MDIEVRKIEDESKLSDSVNIVCQAFLTVAHTFNLTKENASTNAAFTKFSDLIEMQEKGFDMFGVYEDGIQIGFFAILKKENNLYYLNKLAVLPEYRHKGYGKRVINFISEHVKRNGGGEISIGIINQNSILKDWYKKQGFIEQSVKSYNHLPFEVCMMKMIL